MKFATLKFVSCILLAVLFVVAGTWHFTHTEFYLRIMPSYLPFHRALVLISGACEIACGVGLLVPRWRRAAGIGLILLLVAVLPANVFMLTNQSDTGFDFPVAGLWLRLPLQFVLIAWVWWCKRT